MKDIYELLNDMDIDENEFEEMDVTEIEKARVKKSLKKAMNRKNKVSHWKKNVLAASIIVGLAATTFGVSFPAYAGSIPIVGDIFRFLDNGRTGLYENYKEYSTEMDMTEENQGIRFTVNDAIFDGETVSITFSMESDHDLGGKPIMLRDNMFIKEATSNGMTGSSHFLKVEGNNYVGIVNASNFGVNEIETINLVWNIDGFIVSDEQEEIKEIDGKWKFALSLKATESNVISVGQSEEKGGVKVNIEKISVTPMSFIVYYNQEVSTEIRDKFDDVDITLEIKDNLGNTYTGRGNGGSGQDSYTISWSHTFNKLDENATELMITPHVNLRIYTADNHGGVEILPNGEEKEIILTPKSGTERSFTLEGINIELNK